MNIIPARRRDEPTTLFDDVWNRIFGGNGETWPRHLPEALERGSFPRVNVSETESALVIEAELPGMEEKDIDLQIKGNLLVIAGERSWEQEQKGKEFRSVESEYGSFRREIPLPSGLRTASDDVKATYRKGVLRVELPRFEPTPASKVKIKAG